MGTFSEYIEKQLNFPALTLERKRQLVRIAKIRSRDKKREVLVMAANLRTANIPSGIDFSDLLPLGRAQPIERGCLAYPKDDKLVCPNCKSLVDLSMHRAQIEAQARRPVIA